MSTTKVNWYSENQLIVSNEKHQVHTDNSSTTLIITNVESTDQRDYKVVISNEKETVTFKTYLNVQGQKKVVELKPALKQPQPVEKVPELVKKLEPVLRVDHGKDANLHCQFDTSAQVDWYFNETSITERISKYSELREKYEIVYEPARHSTSLIIKNVNEADKGNYLMRAKNSKGFCTSECLVDIQPGESMSSPFPTIIPRHLFFILILMLD